MAAADAIQKKRGAPQRAPSVKGYGMFSMVKTDGQPDLSFIREGFVKFTPAKANVVLTHCRYDRQRDETRAPDHIATLAEMMRRGLWMDKSQLDFARLGSTLILVNGHHRMHAQIDSTKDILWSIVIHDTSSMDEVRSLYYRFDTNLRKRSNANILDGIGYADSVGLTKTGANALFKAAPIIIRGMQPSNKPGSIPHALATRLTDDRLAVCEQYIEEAKEFEAILKNAANNRLRIKLRSGSNFAVAMVTLKANPIIAREFWKGVAEDDGLARGDPRKILVNDLMSRNANSGAMTQQVIAAAKTWNAFAQGRKMSQLKVVDKAVPIEGTGFVVRQ